MDSVVINCGIPKLLTSRIANGKLMCLNNYFLTKKYKEASHAFKRLLILKNTEDSATWCLAIHEMEALTQIR